MEGRFLKNKHMESKKYHYDFVAYTDNLCYGRMEIARGRSKAEVNRLAWKARKGMYVIERQRIYES